MPSSKDLVVAPAGTGQLSGKIPGFKSARRIEIRIDVPDSGAKGQLTFTVDNEEHSSVAVTRDVSLTALVLP